jgi:hypothetical protein
MAKNNKCSCHHLRREDHDFILTTHHPKCMQFNAGWELKSMEDQCHHFLGIINDLKTKIKEMQEIAERID